MHKNTNMDLNESIHLYVDSKAIDIFAVTIAIRIDENRTTVYRIHKHKGNTLAVCIVLDRSIQWINNAEFVPPVRGDSRATAKRRQPAK